MIINLASQEKCEEASPTKFTVEREEHTGFANRGPTVLTMDSGFVPGGEIFGGVGLIPVNLKTQIRDRATPGPQFKRRIKDENHTVIIWWL